MSSFAVSFRIAAVRRASIWPWRQTKTDCFRSMYATSTTNLCIGLPTRDIKHAANCVLKTDFVGCNVGQKPRVAFSGKLVVRRILSCLVARVAS